jgi:hypothetical protein
MTIANSSQRETGARDTGANGGKTTGAAAEGQRNIDRPETRVEGPEIGREVCIGSVDLSIVTKSDNWYRMWYRKTQTRHEHDQDLDLRTTLRRDEAREQAERHRLQMEMMLDRVTQIPTLFERHSQVCAFLEIYWRHSILVAYILRMNIPTYDSE